MAHNHCSSNLGAIQIIQSLEQDHGTEQKQHIISVIEEYEDNEGKRGPSLKYVLCGQNIDLPIFVISICGRTRTGKSLLLNLMIKYLETEVVKNWKDGTVPNVFEWKGGIESITRGIWICPKVFRRKNRYGKEIGILLMDNQGLFDGEQTEGVSTAISGISTVLSSYQLYNVKDKICDNDLESIWRHLMSDGTYTPEDCPTKLMFVVRDYLGEDEGCGLNHGQGYIEAEMLRGTKDHQDMWKGLKKTFSDIKCLLLPLPGTKVMKGNFKEIKDIDPEFLKEVEQFFTRILDTELLIVNKDLPTGQMIFETLHKFNGKVADESLSFVNVFTEQGNDVNFIMMINLSSSIIDNFESRIKGGESLNGQLVIEKFITMSRKKFKGKSADDYLVKLKEDMTRRINDVVKNWILTEYEARLKRSSNLKYTHSLEWESVTHRMTGFVGSNAEKDYLKEQVITVYADLYYIRLREDLLLIFQNTCKNKDLNQLEGYDAVFISDSFLENSDFRSLQTTAGLICHAIWLREKLIFRTSAHKILLQSVAALTKVDSEWLQKVTKEQFKFYEIFTWNFCHSIKINNGDSLQELVGYTLYQKVQAYHEYSRDERKHISDFTKKINKNSHTQLTVTIIFIFCHHKKATYKEGVPPCEPVFKVQNGSSYTFIDMKGREYKNWDDFQRDNKLPPDCLYCHPSQGEYSKDRGFKVGFTWSPATDLGEKVLNTVDLGAKVVSVTSAGVLGATLAIPVAPILAFGGAVAAASAGTYGFVRGFMKIKDKKNHNESVTGEDVMDMIANTASVATAGISTAFRGLAIIGKELVFAPAIGKIISGLPCLLMISDKKNICHLSHINDMSMLLLFNDKSLKGAINNIRECYNLPLGISILDTLNEFIVRNSITFPIKDGDRLTTNEFLSENLRSLLLTTVLYNVEKRIFQFLENLIANSEDLIPLQSAFRNDSQRKKSASFVEVLVVLTINITFNKRKKRPVLTNFCGMEYYPANDVLGDLALAGVCTGLTDIADKENTRLVCNIIKEILKFACDNTETTDLKDLTDWLINNGDEITIKCINKFKLS